MRTFLRVLYRMICVLIAQIAGGSLSATPLNSNARCLASNGFQFGKQLFSAIPTLPMVSLVAFRMCQNISLFHLSSSIYRRNLNL